MRPTAALFLLILAPLFAVAATPVVNSGTINYSTNQITLTGSGFQPNKAKPTIAFNGSALTVSTFSNIQVTATLPTGLTPGTFNLTVTNSQGNSVDFNMTYGATGPQGPAGPAGPTGPQGPAGLAGATGATGATGPRGLTGAPGAPGPAGANGTSFIFLDTYNPYATYAAENVVTYNGSSYVAIVANGPNPSGPAPDQNPSWSLMAAAGAIGTTGPQGLQGAPGPEGMTGLMGNPGPAGPGGPAGPQGPTGGVLSFVVSTQQGNVDLNGGQNVVVNSLVLPNVGTYVIGGQQTIVSLNPGSGSIFAECYLSDGVNQSPGLTISNQSVSFSTILPLAGYYVAQSAPITLTEYCAVSDSDASDSSAHPGVLTAIQVQ
jgi:hypothetical protein